MDTMQAIIASVSTYIVVGEVGLYTCAALQGVPFGRNISERAQMECVTNCSVTTIVSGSYFW